MSKAIDPLSPPQGWDAIKAKYLDRPDIRTLPRWEQEARWERQQVRIVRYLSDLAGIGIDPYFVDPACI